MKKCATFLAAALATLPVILPAMSHAADAYPNKPVRMIVPFGASSGLDPVARALAERLTAQTGQSFIVENREGAGGTVGVKAGASAAPDGYTITMIVHPPFAAAPYLQRKLPYDPINDFVPITRVSTTPLILIANNDAPFKTMAEMVSYARANPGKLNYASSGIGTASHLYMEQVKLAQNLKITFIPYKSTGQQMTDTIGGQVHLSLPSLIGGMPQVQGGKVRLLAVGTAQRHPNIPNTPTFAEGFNQPGFEAVVWYGFVGPKGMPEAAVAKLNAEFGIALNSPQVTKVLTDSGAEKAPSTPAEFAAMINSGATNAQRIIKELKIELQD